jgi:hypothetical protein
MTPPCPDHRVSHIEPRGDSGGSAFGNVAFRDLADRIRARGRPNSAKRDVVSPGPRATRNRAALSRSGVVSDLISGTGPRARGSETVVASVMSPVRARTAASTVGPSKPRYREHQVVVYRQGGKAEIGGGLGVATGPEIRGSHHQSPSAAGEPRTSSSPPGRVLSGPPVWRRSARGRDAGGVGDHVTAPRKKSP